MKSVVFICVLFVAQGKLLYGGGWQSAPEEEKLSPAKILLKGFLTGMALDSSIDSISPCLADVEGLSKDLLSAAEELQTMTPVNLMKATKLIKSSLKDLPESIQTCKAELKSDYLRTKSALQAIASPTSLNFDSEHISINNVNLYSDINLLSLYLKNRSWFNIGFTFGSILGRLSGTGTISPST